MTNYNNPVANPRIVLREEFDDWAVLFDPDSGDAFGLNPVSVFIWKLLDGSHNLTDILKKLRENCKNIPEEAESDINDFVNDLVDRGFAGFGTTAEKRRLVMDDKKLTYEKPIFSILGASDSEAPGAADGAGPGDMGACDVGQAAGYLCGLGFSPALLCGEGAGDEG